MKKFDNLSFLVILILIILDGAVWVQIVFSIEGEEVQFSFLDVGQGDGTLGIFKGGMKFLVDAGPGAKIVSSLEEILSSSDKYIDLALITHPQLDHFGGFNHVLEKYSVGAFVMNGREVDLPEWIELVAKIEAKNIPIFVLGAGDRITFRENSIDFLSPDRRQIQSAELNDSSLVNLIRTSNGSVLLTGDIGKNIEDYLLKKFGVEGLRADILKVPHHGSKYSSSGEFLKTVRPRIGVVEVGRNNYGHPTKETLQRLEENFIKVFRTDLLGTVNLRLTEGKVSVYSSR